MATSKKQRSKTEQRRGMDTAAALLSYVFAYCSLPSPSDCSGASSNSNALTGSTWPA